MAADLSFLHDYVTEQILVKIPCIKSIVRCTSVCKSWYAFIKSPRFINFHLSVSNSYHDKEYFLCSYNNEPHHSIQYNDDQKLQTCYDLEFPHENSVMIIGSINGLICYTPTYHGNGPRRIYIWNPSIRKLRILPKSKFYQEESVYGFWFDANGNDYKVAKINYEVMRCNVEVYSLSTNSWDLIATGGPDLGIRPWENIIHVNGTLHWLICRSKSWMIISFNISNGIFKETLIREEWANVSRLALLKTESLGRSFFILQYQFMWRLTSTCRVYDEGLKELCMRNLELSHLIGVRNNHSNEVLFLNYGTYSKLSVCNVEDSSEIDQAFELKDFCYSGGAMKLIIQIQPFAESLVLLND